MNPHLQARLPYVLASAAGAAVWALQQPLDKRAFAYDYDDVALLGKLGATRGWWVRGFALHCANAALLGAAFYELERRRPDAHPYFNGLSFAMAEHFGLFPLSVLADRFHPATQRGDHPRIWGSARALAQATWRHLLWGLVISEAARRLRQPRASGAQPSRQAARWAAVRRTRPGTRQPS